MNGEMTDRLDRIETLLTAVLMLKVRDTQLVEDKARAEARSIEGLLYLAGMTSPTQIAQIVGKTRQSVSLRLKNEGLT